MVYSILGNLLLKKLGTKEYGCKIFIEKSANNLVVKKLKADKENFKNAAWIHPEILKCV